MPEPPQRFDQPVVTQNFACRRKNFRCQQLDESAFA